ncbi:hypothetical protein C8Q74DRAFT_1029426 [Fomes fomentarius]|nr:hypothetical protein C8Q74DRAFT_1029426 [Fomes fomentarius]
MTVADDALSINPNVQITFNALYLLQITKVDAIGIALLASSLALTMMSSTAQVTVCGSCSCLMPDEIPTLVASYTLALVEIMSTLPDEIALIWPGRLTVVKAIFLVNRYLVLIDTTFAVISAIPTQDTKVDPIHMHMRVELMLTTITHTPDNQLCSITYQTLAYFYVVGIVLSEIILIIRTVALWGFNEYVKFLLYGVLLEMVPFTLYCVYQAVAWIDYPNIDRLRITGCVPATQAQDIWPAYACFILGETAIISLTIVKRFMNDTSFEGRSEGRLLYTMYRDGSFFYAIVLAMSVINMLVMWVAPHELTLSTQLPLRVVHSALCTRVLLNLRKAAMDTGGGAEDEFSKQSTVVFALSPSEP